MNWVQGVVEEVLLGDQVKSEQGLSETGPPRWRLAAGRHSYRVSFKVPWGIVAGAIKTPRRRPHP